MALLGRCNRLDDDRLFQHYIEDSLYKGVALSIASSCLFAGLYYYATLLIPLDGEEIFGWRMLLTLLKSVINASQVHRHANLPVYSASAAPRYFVRHSVEGVVLCFAHSNMRDVLKQDAFLLQRHFLFRKPLY